VQLLGFGMAVWYSQVYGSHVGSFHAILGAVVVLIGTLQPLNAALRPHKTEPKTTARVFFEIMHKGLGWLAVLLGVANVLIGIALVREKDYDRSVLSVASVFAVVCVSPAMAFFALASFFPDNRVSRCILGVRKEEDTVGSPSLRYAARCYANDCAPSPSTEQRDAAHGRQKIGVENSQSPPRLLPIILGGKNCTCNDPIYKLPKGRACPEGTVLASLGSTAGTQGRTRSPWAGPRVAMNARAVAPLDVAKEDLDASSEV
jgi:hypothetical protein